MRINERLQLKPLPDLPLVSIVTPSYNQARFIERTIRSILDQDFPRIEYIIADGGSMDGSVDVIKHYGSQLAWWTSEKDKGQTDAINKGLSHATGEILAYLNSDDTLEPGAVTEMVKAFRTNPQAGAVYADANFIDENDKIIGRFPAAQTDYRKLRNGFVHVPQQSCFFRADFWKMVEPLDPTFYFAMDYDLWVRISKIAPMVYIPGQTWANFRLHSDAKTIMADDRCWPEMLKVHFREGGKKLAPIVVKYYLRKLAAHIYAGRDSNCFANRIT